MPETVVALGARKLGGAIIDHFVALGWNAAGVARSEKTLDRVRTAGALALEADASDPRTLASALERARRGLGSLYVGLSCESPFDVDARVSKSPHRSHFLSRSMPSEPPPRECQRPGEGSALRGHDSHP